MSSVTQAGVADFDERAHHPLVVEEAHETLLQRRSGPAPPIAFRRDEELDQVPAAAPGSHLGDSARLVRERHEVAERHRPVRRAEGEGPNRTACSVDSPSAPPADGAGLVTDDSRGICVFGCEIAPAGRLPTAPPPTR